MSSCEFCYYHEVDECHHSPPVRLPRKFTSEVDRTRDETLAWGWPKVQLTDWCGAYKAG